MKAKQRGRGGKLSEVEGASVWADWWASLNDVHYRRRYVLKHFGEELARKGGRSGQEKKACCDYCPDDGETVRCVPPFSQGSSEMGRLCEKMGRLCEKNAEMAFHCERISL